MCVCSLEVPPTACPRSPVLTGSTASDVHGPAPAAGSQTSACWLVQLAVFQHAPILTHPYTLGECNHRNGRDRIKWEYRIECSDQGAGLSCRACAGRANWSATYLHSSLYFPTFVPAKPPWSRNFPSFGPSPECPILRPTHLHNPIVSFTYSLNVLPLHLIIRPITYRSCLTSDFSCSGGDFISCLI